MFRISTQGLLQRDRASLWFNDIWKDPGKRSRCIDAATLWRIRADFARWARNLSGLSLSFSLSSSLYPLDKPTLPLCLCPSLTNVKGRSSISVFESVKPVQKVATKRESKKWNFSRGMAICLGENNRRSVDFRGNTWGREHHSVSVWGHVYATRCNAAG